MTKISIKALLFTLLMTFALFPAAAMPPHPGNTNPSGRERPAPIDESSTPLYQALSKSSSMLKSSSLATGSSDEFPIKVLVILVDYGADVAGTIPVYNDDGYSSGIMPLILVLSAVFVLAAFNRKKWIFPLSAFLVTLSSCPSGGGVDYGDSLYFKTSKTVFSDILNDEGVDMTMANYYYRMSNGNMTLSFDVKGPYRVSKGWQYYGANDSNGYDMYPGELVGEAVDLAKAAGVDFSQYDNGSDGKVETVIVVHAGQGEENQGDEDTIWSHNWTLSSAESNGDGEGPRTYNGVTINNYTIQPEYNNYAGDATIGVFCHEFGHVLGLPDLYDTSGDTNGVGEWSLMGSGSWGSYDGEDPAPLLAWERYDIGGEDWIAIPSPTTGVEHSDLSDIKAYKVTQNTGTTGTSQYFIIELKESSSDWFVPTSGLLVTHIHEGVISSYRGSNKVNYGSSRVHGVNIVEKSDTTSYGTGSLWTSSSPSYSAMPFSSGTLDSTSKPNTNYYTSSSDVTSKTGSSGVTITINSASSFTATF